MINYFCKLNFVLLSQINVLKQNKLNEEAKSDYANSKDSVHFVELTKIKIAIEGAAKSVEVF